MKKNDTKVWKNGKGRSITIAICGVAIVAVLGALTFPKGKMAPDSLVKVDWEKMKKENAKATTGNEIVLPEKTGKQAKLRTGHENLMTEQGMRTESGREKESVTEFASGKNSEELSQDGEVNKAEATSGAGANVWFDENSTLDWPASGPALIDYSMDQTIYFPTLEQYQYNPALLVRGEGGERIHAAQEGIVSAIGQDAKTGTTVTVDMGNGYQAIYGQLKDVAVETGMYVNKGQMLGYLNEPTKYFSVEGPHLYFEILKDGVPVNPKDFIHTQAD